MKLRAIPISANLELPCHIWESQLDTCRGKIVFLHGFTNHSGNYAYVGEWFANQGFDVYAYDHRDHGRSPLRNQPCELEDVVSDAREVIRHVYELNDGKPITLMGSSMGGAISILASQGEVQKMLAGLVLWAPQVVSTARRKFVFKLLSLASGVMPNTKLSTKGVSVNNLPRQCDDKAFTDKIANDDLILRNPSLGLVHRVLAMGDLAAQASYEKGFKVLMLFGGNDTLIFKHDIKMFVKRLDDEGVDIKYIFYPENRHMLWGDLNRETLYQDTLSWMGQ